MASNLCPVTSVLVTYVIHHVSSCQVSGEYTKLWSIWCDWAQNGLRYRPNLTSGTSRPHVFILSFSEPLTTQVTAAYHYNDVTMDSIASQITSLAIVYSAVYSGADQRKHQSSASLAFVRGIHRGPVNSPHKWPVTRKMFPFDDVIICRRVGHDFHFSWRHIRGSVLWQRLAWSGAHAPHVLIRSWSSVLEIRNSE